MIRQGWDTEAILNSLLRVVASISNSIGAVRDTEQMPSAQWGDLTARGQYLSPIFPAGKTRYKTGNITLTKSLSNLHKTAREPQPGRRWPMPGQSRSGACCRSRLFLEEWSSELKAVPAGINI